MYNFRLTSLTGGKWVVKILTFHDFLTGLGNSTEHMLVMTTWHGRDTFPCSIWNLTQS